MTHRHPTRPTHIRARIFRGGRTPRGSGATAPGRDAHRCASSGVALSLALLLAACSDDGGTTAAYQGGTGGTAYPGPGGSSGPGGAVSANGGATGLATGGAGGLVTSGPGGAPGGGYDGGGPIGAGGGPIGATGGAGPATGGTVGAGGGPMSSGGFAADASLGGANGSGGAGPGPAPDKFCGNITTRGQVRSDFITYWDQITPENEGKWGSVEGQRNVMNWAGLDAVHAYAKQHGIPFKEHTLVWGAQQPGWMSNLSQAEQRAEVEEWIRLFCERYPDTQLIDVVNEPPPHTNPVYAAALGGAGASGYDWIVQAFKWADQYCPNAILILNDYNTIEYGNDNSHFIDIVQRIQAAGAPIDAIGAQAHAAFNVPTDTVKGYIDKLVSSTGLPVYISEYDIDLADDGKQKTIMESQFTMFWNHPDVKGVTLWGYVQGSTWLKNSGLMSDTGQQRPAMTWLMGYLGR